MILGLPRDFTFRKTFKPGIKCELSFECVEDACHGDVMVRSWIDHITLIHL